MLTGPEIKRQLEMGNIHISPFDEKKLNPNSYNLTLSKKLVVYEHVITNPPWKRYAHDHFIGMRAIKPWDEKHPFDPMANVEPYGGILDMRKDNPVVEFEIPETGAVLFPGILYLAATIEEAGSACFVPCIEGRSSMGRLGLNVHQTAGFGDCGFQRTWCLELTVIHPLRIFSNVEIVQIAFTTVQGEIRKYRGKYHDQDGPVASKLWTEFHTPITSSQGSEEEKVRAAQSPTG